MNHVYLEVDGTIFVLSGLMYLERFYQNDKHVKLRCAWALGKDITEFVTRSEMVYALRTGVYTASRIVLCLERARETGMAVTSIAIRGILMTF